MTIFDKAIDEKPKAFSNVFYLTKPVDLVINKWNNRVSASKEDHCEDVPTQSDPEIIPDWVGIRGRTSFPLFGIVLTSNLVAACVELTRFNDNDRQV